MQDSNTLSRKPLNFAHFTYKNYYYYYYTRLMAFFPRQPGKPAPER